MQPKNLEDAYDKVANEYLKTRLGGKTRSGFKNRAGEQPLIFSTIQQDLTNKKVLDIGCGPGLHLKEYFKRGANVYGIDISQEMLNLAKEQVPNANLSRCTIDNLMFKNETFDIITVSYVFDHIKNMQKAAHEIYRTLKTDGELIFTIPHPIVNMFRDSKNSTYVPTHSYFDHRIKYFSIGDAGKVFETYPRTLDEWFSIFLQEKMTLLDFKENRPDKKWKDECIDFDETLLKIPFLCCFKWKK